MTPLVKSPLTPLRHLRAVCCAPRAPASNACGGQVALHQRRRLPQQRPSAPCLVRMKSSTGPWPCPLGIAHAHGPGFVALACRAAGPKPTASTPAGPMHPGHDPTTGRSTAALPPCSCARATPAPGRGQGRSAPQRSCGCSCSCAIGSGSTGPARTGRPGLDPTDARLLRWRGLWPQGPSRKQAGPRVPLN